MELTSTGVRLVLREGDVVDGDHSVGPASLPALLSAGEPITSGSCTTAADRCAREVVGIHAKTERFLC